VVHDRTEKPANFIHQPRRNRMDAEFVSNPYRGRGKWDDGDLLRVSWNW